MWRGGTDMRARAALSALGEQAAQLPHHGRASFEPHAAAEELQAALHMKLAAKEKSAQQRPQVAPPLVAPTLHPPKLPSTTAQQAEELASYEQWRAKHPCALSRLDEICGRLRGKRLAVFLDYDGTLTPIVSNPDEALLSPQMREIVRNVARLFPTAIISGRGREKVENFVQLKELYYAGSHGMDIAGPTMGNGTTGTTTNMAFQPAAHFRPMIDSVYQELVRRLDSIPGSSVEHNTFCVSAHFRNCSAERWQDVVAVVEQVVAQNSELRMTRGRKVVEVRPKVNWHKGTALEHLLGALGLHNAPDVVAIYIGDDHTDEDAFKVLRDTHAGFGVLVSTKVRDTAAAYTVRDPAEVGALLQALVQWGSSQHNGWAPNAATSGLGAGPATSASTGASAWRGMAAQPPLPPPPPPPLNAPLQLVQQQLADAHLGSTVVQGATTIAVTSQVALNGSSSGSWICMGGKFQQQLWEQRQQQPQQQRQHANGFGPGHALTGAERQSSNNISANGVVQHIAAAAAANGQ